ncbi:MAG TPA: GPW/gp25 family protein [Thermoanaerobaculia bacterium]
MEIAYPFHIDDRGQVADAPYDAHVEQLIEQLLFTSPGERVNRPTFGCGVIRLLFAPDNDALATANQFLIQGELQRWLGSLIQVKSLSFQSPGATLEITVQYVVQRTGRSGTATFVRPRPVP